MIGKYSVCFRSINWPYFPFLYISAIYQALYPSLSTCSKSKVMHPLRMNLILIWVGVWLRSCRYFIEYTAIFFLKLAASVWVFPVAPITANINTLYMIFSSVRFVKRNPQIKKGFQVFFLLLFLVHFISLPYSFTL